MVDSEVIEIVEKINEEIEEAIWGKDQRQPNFMPYVEFKTNGYVQQLEFLGEYLWDSENDLRKFDEVMDRYETLEDFIRREIGTIVEDIRRINVEDRVIDIESLSRIAYETYCKSVGGVAFNGDKLPDWNNVPGRIADAWRFTIIEVIKHC